MLRLVWWGGSRPHRPAACRAWVLRQSAHEVFCIRGCRLGRRQPLQRHRDPRACSGRERFPQPPPRRSGEAPGVPPWAAPPATPAAGSPPDALAAALAEQAKATAAMAAMQSGAAESTGLLDDIQTGGGPSLRGARGAAALLHWRRAFGERPEAITARIRANRTQALTGLAASPDVHSSFRNYFAQEVPFGHAKTAAYLVFGIADVADLMEGGRWREAEALTCLLLAAAEQAALQEWTWNLAWLLTFSAEPPWAKIRVQPPPQTDLRSMARLADPELLAAAVGHLKDMLAIGEAQRKAGTGAQGGGAGPGAAEGAPAPKGRGRRNQQPHAQQNQNQQQQPPAAPAGGAGRGGGGGAAQG